MGSQESLVGDARGFDGTDTEKGGLMGLSGRGVLTLINHTISESKGAVFVTMKGQKCLVR